MSWQLFLVKGNKDLLRSFVHGFAWGMAKPQGAFCEAELPLEKESLAEWLSGGPHHRVLVEANLADSLAQALEATSEELELLLKERRTVKELTFTAEARAFSREVMKELQEKLFASLLAGVRIAEHSEEKQEDPSARGVELYAPVHQLQYKACITYRGPVEAILAWHKELAGLDFVEVSPLQILEEKAD